MTLTRAGLVLLLAAATGCASAAHPGAAAGGSGGQVSMGGSGGSEPPASNGGAPASGGQGGSAADASSEPPRGPDAAEDTSPPAVPTDAGGGALDPTWIGGPSKPGKFMLVEGFESAQDGQPPDPAIWAGGKVTVGSVRAARGTKALHVLPFNSGSFLIRETKTFPALARSFYTRIFLWVEQQPGAASAGNLYHWTTIEASDQAGGGGRVIRLGGHIDNQVMGGNWLRFNYNTHVNGETGKSDVNAIIPPKTWTCLEAYFDMGAQEARFWMNDMERPALHWKASDPKFPFPAAVQSLSFGWAEYQGTPKPFEVWIDEIAIDAQPIGCAN